MRFQKCIREVESLIVLLLIVKAINFAFSIKIKVWFICGVVGVADHQTKHFTIRQGKVIAGKTLDQFIVVKVVVTVFRSGKDLFEIILVVEYSLRTNGEGNHDKR